MLDLFFALLAVELEIEAENDKPARWDRLSLFLNEHDLHTFGYIILVCIFGGATIYYLRRVMKRYFAKNKID